MLEHDVKASGQRFSVHFYDKFVQGALGEFISQPFACDGAVLIARSGTKPRPKCCKHFSKNKVCAASLQIS